MPHGEKILKQGSVVTETVYRMQLAADYAFQGRKYITAAGVVR